jgi:transcriptional regulator with XRE-family HTH domain
MKAYRKALGLSQAKLAEKVDTSTHYIGMIETKNNFPSPEMLDRIAAALEIDTIDLFFMETNLPEKMKTYRKAALKNIKGLLDQLIDGQLKDLDDEPRHPDSNENADSSRKGVLKAKTRKG